jgi:negative regulator of sigma E activity
MSDILNEQLSALLDGELPPEETTLLLKRLGREAELAQRLNRYRLCGDVLRGERVQPRADFAIRVSAVIAAEAPLAAPARRPARGAFRAHWLKPLAGLAVAASVAVVAVLVLQQNQAARPVPAATVASVAPPSATGAVAAARAARSAPAYAQGSDEPVSYVTPAVRPRLGVIPETTLANYVVAHEVSTPLAGRHVLIHLIADESRGDAPAQ